MTVIYQGTYREHPLLSIFFLLCIGSTVINTVSVFYFFDETTSQIFAAEVYSIGVATFSVLMLCKILISRKKSSFFGKFTIFEIESRPLFLISSLTIFLLVSFSFLLAGYESRSPYASQEWRNAVAGSASGYLYLIYNSGVIIFILISLSEKISHRIRIFLLFCIGFCLLVYGGRFLLFCCVGVSYLLFIRNYPPKIFFVRCILALVFIAFGLVALAFVRYTQSNDLSLSVIVFYDTMVRQLSGPVYDFALSFERLDLDFIRLLLLQKLQIASLPLLFDSSQEISSGLYLASHALRDFEFGHRISAFGEAFYLLGIPGPIVSSTIYFASLLAADRLSYMSRNFSLASITFCFGIIFSFFIDFTFYLTSIYLSLYFYILFFATFLFHRK